MFERLHIIASNVEPENKHVIWLKDYTLKRFSGIGWKNIAGGGTTNYKELNNKPSINGVKLEGNVSSEDLGIQAKVEVVDNLLSTDADKPLSANQGYLLNNAVLDLNAKLEDIEIAEATDVKLGGILIGYSQNGKNYPVLLEDGKAYVNVPWINTTYGVASASSAGLIKTGYTNTGKNYKVQVDTNGNAYVNVPWTDNNTTYSEATTSTAGLMSTTDKSKLNGVANNANNYTHPTYTARTGKPTANQTPGFGDTVTITQVVSDTTGHVSNMTDRTIKIPNAVATQESAGLMSAEDKIRLDGVTGSNVVITTSAEYTAMQAAGTLDDNTVYFLKG